MADLSHWYREDAKPSYRYNCLEMLAREGMLSTDDKRVFDSIEVPEEEFSEEDKRQLRTLYDKYFKPQEHRNTR